MLCFLRRLGFETIIPHEQPSRGRTVLEKVGVHRDVGFAFVPSTQTMWGVGRSVRGLIDSAVCQSAPAGGESSDTTAVWAVPGTAVARGVGELLAGADPGGSEGPGRKDVGIVG